MNVSYLKITPPPKKNRNEFDMYQTRITFNSVKNESKSYNNIKPLQKIAAILKYHHLKDTFTYFRFTWKLHSIS